MLDKFLGVKELAEADFENRKIRTVRKFSAGKR